MSRWRSCWHCIVGAGRLTLGLCRMALLVNFLSMPVISGFTSVGWLLKISGKYLQAGRLSRWQMMPYLTPEEGLQAVYKYSEVYGEPITNETARLINELCLSDPFFISCVMRSNYEERDLTTEKGVINTVNYEITDRESELSETWREYLEVTFNGDHHKIRCS